MELHFTRTNGPVDEAIDKLTDMVGDISNPGIIREMILAALKAGIEHASREDMRLMNYTMKEMRFTAKIFGEYSNVRKVTVFGSARTQPDEPVYAIAREFGKKLADAGYMVITGAGGGIMQAVNEGEGPEKFFGVNVTLPFEQKPKRMLRRLGRQTAGAPLDAEPRILLKPLAAVRQNQLDRRSALPLYPVALRLHVDAPTPVEQVVDIGDNRDRGKGAQ